MNKAPPDGLDDDGGDGDADAELAVLLALGRREREREAALLDARAPEWAAVANAELSVEAAVERRREAGDEHVDRGAAYFRPFDADESSALLDALLTEPESESESESEPEPESAAPDNVVPLVRPKAPSADDPSPTPAPPHEPGSGIWWIPAGLLATAAAAILLWWVWPPNQEVRELGGEGGEPKLAVREPLPSYVLETDGGLKQLRGDTSDTSDTEADPAELGRHRYRRDTPFEWVLRPKASVDGEVGVRGFAFVDGGSAGLPLNVDPLVQIAETGAIRITGKIGQLGLEPGRYTIALAVGRPDALPERAADAAASSNAGSPTSPMSWELRRVEILIED